MEGQRGKRPAAASAAGKLAPTDQAGTGEQAGIHPRSRFSAGKPRPILAGDPTVRRPAIPSRGMRHLMCIGRPPMNPNSPFRGRRWCAVLLLLSACADDPDQSYYEFQESRGYREDELRGEGVYLRYCVGCHGVEGKGDGDAAPFLDPKPRDFTRGVFKFRSTPSGSLPTDEDLLRTLRQGVHGTAMPPWAQLAEYELKALIAYVKTFSPRFERSRPQPSIALAGAPTDLESSSRVARGKEIWTAMQCASCHGEGGKGDGPSAKNLTDSELNPIIPFDFTRRSPKGGARPEDF